MFQGICSSRRVSGAGGATNAKKEAGNQGPKANSGAGDWSLKPHGAPLCWETGPIPPVAQSRLRGAVTTQPPERESG